jgi:hypothetical protein
MKPVQPLHPSQNQICSTAKRRIGCGYAKMVMIRLKHIAALGAAISVFTQWCTAPSARAQGGGQEAVMTGNPAPSDEQIHALLARAIRNQHANDRALEEFERIEQVISHKPGENGDTRTERTERILPYGNGTLKLKLSENDSHVSQEVYRSELEFAVNALEIAIHPNDRYKQDLAKFQKRRRERAELVDAAEKAFRPTWAGRETRGSRTLEKFILEPDPDFKPANRAQSIFEHVRATIWVDESQSQFARLEADITSDITIVGGIVGKVYHGGHFAMEQSEVEPGVWLPTQYIYDVDGRKFLFGFGVHERTEISRYRRVWPPEHAIELVRNELNKLSAESPAR